MQKEQTRKKNLARLLFFAYEVQCDASRSITPSRLHAKFRQDLRKVFHAVLFGKLAHNTAGNARGEYVRGDILRHHAARADHNAARAAAVHIHVIDLAAGAALEIDGTVHPTAGLAVTAIASSATRC